MQIDASFHTAAISLKEEPYPNKEVASTGDPEKSDDAEKTGDWVHDD